MTKNEEVYPKKPTASLIRDNWSSLEDWLAALRSPETFDQLARFPTDELRDEYIESLDTRPEDEIRTLLRRLLPNNMDIIGQHDMNLMLFDFIQKEHPDLVEQYLKSEFWRRTLNIDLTDETSYQGVTWVLDLLPNHPHQALQALDAYFYAHMIHLTDDLIHALGDAEDIIRARWIGHPRSVAEKQQFLSSLAPRDLEHLVERLYSEMGYETILTPESKDGGRDILGSHQGSAKREEIRIEVKKRTSKPVGVECARSLLGIVSNEKVNKGVLVTNNKFTRGTEGLAAQNSRIELINGIELVKLFNEYLGTTWSSRLSYLINHSRQVHKE